ENTQRARPARQRQYRGQALTLQIDRCGLANLRPRDHASKADEQIDRFPGIVVAYAVANQHRAAALIADQLSYDLRLAVADGQRSFGVCQIALVLSLRSLPPLARQFVICDVHGPDALARNAQRDAELG